MDFLGNYSYYYYAGIALQVICAVHVIRTGRAYWWLFIILFFSIVGCLIYAIVEMLPDIRRDGWRAFNGVLKVVDPKRGVRHHADRLAISGSAENKLRLAEEHIDAGEVNEAIPLLESCLVGVHKDDPKLLFALAKAYFGAGRYADVRATFDRLLEANPQFKSPDAHLLYARSLELLGKTADALEEYAVLVTYYPGLEAMGRYALLLKSVGRNDEAQPLFKEIAVKARHFGGYYRKEKKWVQTARENLS